jgi:hypothetical protein
MGGAVTLFPSLAPPRAPDGIDLRRCDVRDILDTRGARLIVADPPWRYDNAPGVANPEVEGIYAGCSDAEVGAILDAAYDCGTTGCRLACWATWPKLTELAAAGGAGPRWRYVSGGAWLKLEHVGVGYHWRGHTEPVLLYTREGATGRPAVMIGNGHASLAGEHSRKPLGWLREWVRAWTDPGDLVLDLWAGTAPLALACALEDRRYVGSEIDPERHGWALTMLRDAWVAR